MKTSKFKMTEIGEIPADWDTSTIASFATVETGNRNTQDKCASGLYPFYVRSPIVERIDDYGYDTEGVITVGDGVGTGKVFHYVNGKFALHQRCYLISNFREDIWPRYFYTIFSTRFFDRVMQMTAKSSVDSVRREMITGMEIPIPPLAEQKAIAEALSDVDALIAAQEELIEKKRAIKQGAMQELLGIRNEGEGIGNEELGVRNCEAGAKKLPRRRLPGFSGEWVEKRFDECFIHIPSKAYQVQATSYLGGGMYDVVDQGQSDVVGYTNDSSRLFRVPYDGVIIFGDHTRVVKFRLKDFVVGADGTQLLIGRNADTRFLSLLLGLLKIPNLGYSRHFKYVKEGLYLLPPTLAEQRKIAEVLSDMDAEIEALEAKRAKYESIKQGMMQELLTGKTRLKGV